LQHSGSSPCLLALFALAAVLSTQPPTPALIGDLGAERELALSSTPSGPTLEVASPVTSDAEFLPQSAFSRLARKTPPVVKSQIAMTPEIPRPASPPVDRSPGRAAPPLLRRALFRVQTRGTISSVPSESLLDG